MEPVNETASVQHQGPERRGRGGVTGGGVGLQEEGWGYRRGGVGWGGEGRGMIRRGGEGDDREGCGGEGDNREGWGGVTGGG